MVKANSNTRVPQVIQAHKYHQISAFCIAWYRDYHRKLPFRETRDPYSILVSEIMLQQTQVATVIPYFHAFMAKFPTLIDLATAVEQDILAAWAGLGYYRRARMLHAAAKAIVTNHEGEFPRTLKEIAALPGVGRYTAGAVYSFAYDLPAPIVEANTSRLFARLFCIRGDWQRDAKVKEKLWAAAVKLLPQKGAREHNYAVMELGALVCRPVPLCYSCPVSKHCLAYQRHLVDVIPPPRTRPQTVPVQIAGVVLRKGDSFLMRRIPAGEWHAGMFEFPTAMTNGGSDSKAIEQRLKEALGCGAAMVSPAAPFATLRYSVTHHKVTLSVYAAQVDASAHLTNSTGEYTWQSRAEIAALPQGSAQRKVLDLLNQELEQSRSLL